MSGRSFNLHDVLMKKLKKSRGTPKLESHRQQLERVLKQILAGKISIEDTAKMTKESPRAPYRRLIE